MSGSESGMYLQRAIKPPNAHQESCFSSSGTSGRVMFMNYKHDILFVSLKVCIWLLNLVTNFQDSFTLLLGTSIHLLVTLMRDEQLLHV